MQKQEDFYQKVEKLEKDLWALVKYTLPKLKQEIILMVGSGSSDKIKSQVEQNTSKLQEISQTLTNLRSYVDGINSDVVSCMQQVEALSTKTTSIEGQISTLKDLPESFSALEETVNQSQTEFAQLSQAVNQSQTEFAQLSQSVSQVESAQEENANQIATFSGDIETLNSFKETAAYDIQLLQLNEKANEGNIGTLVQTIGQLRKVDTSTTESLTELETRVASLEETALTGGARLRTVIYDMNSEDENVNKGFKGGVQGNNTISWTDDFDYIRIFASMGGSLGYAEFPLANRYRNDALLTNVIPTGNVVHFFKCTIKDTDKQIFVGKGFTYTFNTESNSLTMESGYKSDYYITRLEGIKGV